jgi:hypothetical protein
VTITAVAAESKKATHMHTSRDPRDSKFETARRRLIEVEASIVQALTTARVSITELEEENHALRREALERRTEFYTEREFAALLKVSESTIRRLRKAHRIEPLMVGDSIRYSSLHVEQIHDIFRPRRRAASFVDPAVTCENHRSQN